MTEINPQSNESLEDIFSIIQEYNTPFEYVNFKKLGFDSPPEVLQEAIENLSPDDIHNFVNLLVTLHRDSETEMLEETIRIFFKYAPSHVQNDFFQHHSRLHGNALPLDYIFSLIPDDITFLNFENCRYIDDYNVGVLINHLKNLQSLKFSCSMTLTDKIVEKIAKSPNAQFLEELSFSRMNLTDEAAYSIARSVNLNRLNKLTLSCRGISDQGIIALGNSRNFRLQELDLSGTCISLAGLRNFVDSPHVNGIHALNLSYCRGIGDEAMVAIVNRYYIDNNDNIEVSMPNLKKLNLNGCSFLSDIGLSALANSTSLEQLEELSLIDCNGITIDGIKLITESPTLPKLKFVLNDTPKARPALT